MDYKNGKIYTIRSHLTEKFYIGATTQALCKRMDGHRSNFKTYYENSNKSYVSSYEIIKLGDAYMELLEIYPCETKEQLKRREGELIRQYKQTLVNKVIAGRTNKEWKEENKERMKNIRKIYREKNKDKIKEYFITNKPLLKIKRQEKYKANKKPRIPRTQEQIDASKKKKYERDRLRKSLRTPEEKEKARINHNNQQKIRRSHHKLT